MKPEYLKIIKARDEEDCYIMLNIKQNVKIGYIEKRRVGKFMHWCVVVPKDLLDGADEIFFTNGCLKEISKFITKLYREERDGML